MRLEWKSVRNSRWELEEVSKETPEVDIIVCTVNLLNYTKLAFESGDGWSLFWIYRRD